MEGDNELRRALIDFVKKVFPDGFIFQAVVKDVDMNNKTCTIVTEGMDDEIPGVLLQANVNSNDDGIIPIPVINTDVWCGIINNDENQIFVIKCTEVEEYIINTKLTTFNKGNNGGLVIVGKAKDNFNAVKQYLATMKAAIASGLTAVGAGTAANGATGASSFNSAMAGASINIQDMENTKVKH